MKKWIKRYIILTICLLLFILPTLSVVMVYKAINTTTSKIIFYSILGVIIVLYYGIMTYFMLKNRK